MRQRPLSIIWLRRLLLFRLSLLAIIYATIAFVLFYQPSESWLTKVVYLILKRTGNGIGNEIENPAYVLYYLSGFYIFSILFILLEYFCIIKRKMVGFWIAFAFDVFSTLAEKNLPIIPFIILILATRKTALSFFKGANDQADQNILDDDIL